MLFGGGVSPILLYTLFNSSANASFRRFSSTTTALSAGFVPLVNLALPCACRPTTWGRLGFDTPGLVGSGAVAPTPPCPLGALPNDMFSACNCCIGPMPSFVDALSANWWAARQRVAMFSTCSASLSAAGAIAGWRLQLHAPEIKSVQATGVWHACAKAHLMPMVALLACNMDARAGRNASSCSTTSAPFPLVMARWQAGASAWVTGSGAISVRASEFFCSATVNTVQQCLQCTPEAHTPHVQSMYLRVSPANTRDTTRPEKRTWLSCRAPFWICAPSAALWTKPSSFRFR